MVSNTKKRRSFRPASLYIFDYHFYDQEFNTFSHLNSIIAVLLSVISDDRTSFSDFKASRLFRLSPSIVSWRSKSPLAFCSLEFSRDNSFICTSSWEQIVSFSSFIFLIFYKLLIKR